MIADASRDSRTDRDIEVHVCNFLDFSCLIAEVIWVRFRREALLSPRLRHCRSSCCQRSKAWSRQSDSSCPSKWWSEWSDAFDFWSGDECEIISERGQVFLKPVLHCDAFPSLNRRGKRRGRLERRPMYCYSIISTMRRVLGSTKTVRPFTTVYRCSRTPYSGGTS